MENYIEEVNRTLLNLRGRTVTSPEHYQELLKKELIALTAEVDRRAREEERAEIIKEWLRVNEEPESAIYNFGSYLFPSPKA